MLCVCVRAYVCGMCVHVLCVCVWCVDRLFQNILVFVNVEQHSTNQATDVLTDQVIAKCLGKLPEGPAIMVLLWAVSSSISSTYECISVYGMAWYGVSIHHFMKIQYI